MLVSLFILCWQQGLFAAHFFTGFIFFDTYDGPSECLDTMEKANDDDEENTSYSCQSHHDNHFSKLFFISTITVASFKSLDGHKV